MNAGPSGDDRGQSAREGRAWFDSAVALGIRRMPVVLAAAALCVSLPSMTATPSAAAASGSASPTSMHLNCRTVPSARTVAGPTPGAISLPGEASRVALVRLRLARAGHDHAAWHRSLWADACHDLGERRGRRRLPDRAGPREALALTRPFAGGGTLKFPDQPALRAGADARGRGGRAERNRGFSRDLVLTCPDMRRRESAARGGCGMDTGVVPGCPDGMQPRQTGRNAWEPAA